MVWVDLMDECCKFLHGVPNPGVCVLQVNLIPNAPKQKSRVILVLEHLLLQFFQLPFNCIFIVVVHARSFRSEIQTKHDRHSTFVG